MLPSGAYGFLGLGLFTKTRLPVDDLATQPHPVHFLPIATTVLSAVYCFTLVRRYRLKGKGAHLLWWASGVFCYGLGTALESAVTLLGNSPGLNKAWYTAGALFGGYPLAQGTVYLLLRRRTANVLSAITLPFTVSDDLKTVACATQRSACESATVLRSSLTGNGTVWDAPEWSIRLPRLGAFYKDEIACG